jgi:hypothetical protein
MKLRPWCKCAVGRLRLFVRGRSLRGTSAHRGRRHPAGAHTGAVGSSSRLHCGTRAEVAPRNSLRSLRSLRSNRRGESVNEARWRAPTSALRSSPPQKSPPPRTARRESTIVARVPCARRCIGKGAGGQPAARLCAAEKRRACGRARSALRDPTRRVCPSAVSAANAASYTTGPRDRASQGTLAQRGPATKRCRLPACSFARADVRAQCG